MPTSPAPSHQASSSSSEESLFPLTVTSPEDASTLSTMAHDQPHLAVGGTKNITDIEKVEIDEIRAGLKAIRDQALAQFKARYPHGCIIDPSDAEFLE